MVDKAENAREGRAAGAALVLGADKHLRVGAAGSHTTVAFRGGGSRVDWLP